MYTKYGWWYETIIKKQEGNSKILVRKRFIIKLNQRINENPIRENSCVE